ncbi:hybrid sensor histidine kinase/response regulator transcription factor [Bacteroides sp. 519]|uniref:hybrid sensor histidine kinase/response regulator transcription factor n=1 Tax=Bacteroides sp. 519 TaxID=2302937 RepID=UPI0013D74001|nr:hybrid sensor histidine kinase/response regulator transcription factor [Bacteroides sp. 519]NDV58236.1 hybrid sensor histidine kinase/response regulator [Bacteroides sp. 519]
MQLRLINIIILILSSIYLQGQPTYKLFNNITLSPEASVISCFSQDAQGLIWIGSDKGLFSYDGYSTRQHFSFGQAGNTRINCITATNSYLYLGADNGIHVYNYKTDQYEKREVNFPSNVRAMVIRNDVLWIGTLNGLYTYHFQTNELFKIARESNPGLSHETIYSLIHAKDDNIYIGTYNGFCKYNTAQNQFERITIPANIGRSNQFINSLLEDNTRNCIWVGTEGNLYQYFPTDNTSRTIEVVNNNSIKALALDENNQLLAGTDNGLYVYNEKEPIQHILHDSRYSQSLSNNIVWSIFKDKDKNIWLGTDYGISLSKFNNSFRYIPIAGITGTGEGNHFYSLSRDSKDVFWFGGTNGIIKFNSLDHPQNTVWYKMGDPQHTLVHNRIRHIFEDSNQELWIATDGSVNRYDRKNNRFIHYNIVDSTNTYNANWAYNILEDKKGRLWIATCLGGLFVVDKEKLVHTQNGNYVADYNFTTQNGISGMFINQLVADNDGNIWVSYYNDGVDKINPETFETTTIPVGEMIKGKYLTYIIADNKGMIWGGYRGGVLCINPADNSFKTINLNQFTDNEVLALAEIDDYIWITTTDGAWVLNKETLHVKRINLMNHTFSSLYYDKKDKKIYMGTVDGIAVVSPNIIEISANEHPVIITGVQVNNEPLVAEHTEILGENSIRYSNSITLKHSQNNLRFDISDFPYMLEEKNRLIYKLDGIEKEWFILPSGSNQISYSNLDYGKYTLHISKLNENSKPSQTITSIPILIKAPWYYTNWAKIIYILLFVSLVAWIINFFRVKNKLRIERIEKERITEQSKSKIDFFTNMSHELKTPLSMIIAPVSKLLIDVKNQQEKQQLEVVQRNAMKLNSLIHQVLDLNRMDNDASSSLILSKVEFVAFAKGILSVYTEGIAKEKNISFEFQSNIPKLYLEVDLIKFESILNNLLSNAYKYTPVGGRVILSLKYKEEKQQIELSVSDNGSGIPAKDIPYIFQRFFQSPKTSGKKEGTGIGLYLVKTYTELHGGNIQVISEEETGTTIIITLPVQTDILTDESRVLPNIASNIDKPLILIVEDNAEIAEFIGQIVSPQYRFEIAENGKSGLTTATALLPHLIITDLMMPVMDGLEMSLQLKKNIPTSTIPIILLTAKNDKQTELESIHLNIDAFIPKPFEPDILLSRIEQLLASKQQMETKARIEVIATPKAIDAVSLDEKFLANITQIIEDKVSDPDLNVNALSDLSGINNKQLYRKIKQLTGMTPLEYIKSIRLKKAAMLLEQKKFTVAEVMYMVGYSNHSYFSKCFQAEFGKTPKQYLEA